MDDHSWNQVQQYGQSALAAAINNDPDAYPQPDDHVARLDEEQREMLYAALTVVLGIVENMRGAS